MTFDLNNDLENSVSKDLIRLLIDVVAEKSWWVNPLIYKRIKNIFPKTRRAHHNEDRRQITEDGIQLWNNEIPQKALQRSPGNPRPKFRHGNVCHIYEGSVYLRTHYSNLANLVLLPRSIASLSE
jgi:hypothetical protein